MKRNWVRPGQLFLYILLLGAVLAGCKKEGDKHHEAHDNHEEAINHGSDMRSDDDFRRNHKRLSFVTVLELLKVRWATAKYRNIEVAKRDGYASIDVVVENMGHHFMKATLTDEKFEITKPEILVYNKDEAGRFTLVAVEYAVPLDKSAEAPRGFTGNADVWDRNTGFGLWLLHAWVWHHNPDGVFNPTNPKVHTHE